MSRYTGPRVKLMRALGLDLPGLSPKTSDRRPYPPGQHGQRRRKETEFGKRLQEKQKLRMNYGLSEAQMRNIFHEALRSQSNTGTKLIELLERRLDNVVFRAGFARSIPAARQLVNHGHILVNGKRVDIPSFRVRKGDVVSLSPKATAMIVIQHNIDVLDRSVVGWLEVGDGGKQVTVRDLPQREHIDVPVRESLIVELYSK
jgi:small subunit ribosomal protein S4